MLSPGMQVYDRLIKLTEAYPISGNRGGSYLTALSIGAFEINLIYVSPHFLTGIPL